MNEYQKIADELQVRSNAVHLVHFVLNNMKVSCIFPPSPAQERAEFYTPENICVAIKAYLLAKYPDNPWETLNDFGIPSSRDIGRIVAALQDCDETKVVKKLKPRRKQFAACFADRDSFFALPAVLWRDELRKMQRRNLKSLTKF